MAVKVFLYMALKSVWSRTEAVFISPCMIRISELLPWIELCLLLSAIEFFDNP
jgi:hypothetical protein